MSAKPNPNQKPFGFPPPALLFLLMDFSTNDNEAITYMNFLTKKASFSVMTLLGLMIVVAGVVVWASNNNDTVEDLIG